MATYDHRERSSAQGRALEIKAEDWQFRAKRFGRTAVGSAVVTVVDAIPSFITNNPYGEAALGLATSLAAVSGIGAGVAAYAGALRHAQALSADQALEPFVLPTVSISTR